MPFRINGIGTMYLGRKDLREYRGTCENCGKLTVLRDYQTRVWLTAIVPILPVGRRQILSYCPLCTSHRVMSLADWQRFNESYIRDASEELAGDPANADLAMSLLTTLTIVARDDDAAALAEQMARTFADDADALRRLAGWYRLTGSLDRAEATYTQAASLDPNLRAAAIGLATIEVERGQPDRAHQRLKALQQSDEPIDPDLLLSVATTYQDQNNHHAALEVFETVLADHPEIGHDKDFRNMVRTSEQAAGDGSTILPRRRIGAKRILAAAVAILTIAGVLGVNHYVATHRTLYLVNGLSDPVDVTIGEGNAVQVGPYKSRRITIAEGDHRAIITLDDGTAHSQEFTLEGAFVKRIFSRPTCVLNLLGAALLAEETVWFSANPASTREPSQILHAGADLLLFSDVDYVFADLPTSITTDQTRDVAMTRLGVVDLAPFVVMDWAATIDDMTNRHALLTHAESHLALNPGDIYLLRTYYAFGERADAQPRCRDFLAGRLDERPRRMHWHRYYQETCEATGQAAEALARYEEALADDEDNSQLLYLVGRLQPYSSAAIDYGDRAIAADPTNAFAWLAKAYYLQSLGKFAHAENAAAEAISTAADAITGLSAIATMDRLALAQGHYDELIRKSRESLADNRVDLTAQTQLMATLILAGDTAAAEAAHTQYAAAVATEMPDNLHKVQIRSELALHYLLGDYGAVEAIAPTLDLPTTAQLYAFEAALSAGKIDEALAAVPSSRLQSSWPRQLAIAVAANAQGKSDVADGLRTMAIETLSQRGLAEQAAAAMLADPTAANADLAEDLAMDSGEKALVLVALVQGGGDRRLLDLAETLNFDPGFPHPVIREAIEHARRQPE